MLLSLRVPATNQRGPQYMEQVLAAVHQANSGHLPITLTLGRLDQAVSLMLRCPPELRSVLRSQLYAQYPECSIDELPDASYPGKEGNVVWSMDVHLHADLFPIKRYPQFEDAQNRNIADPLSALLTALAAERKADAQCWVEITARPVRRKLHRRTEKCLRRLSSPFFNAHPRLAHLYVSLALSRFPALRLAGYALGQFAPVQIQSAHDPLATSSGRLHEREEHLQAAADKLGRPLFETHIRILVAGKTEDALRAADNLNAIAGTFGVFRAPGLATFRPSHVRRYRRKRIRFHGRTSLLSAEELATIFHAPTQTVRAPTMAIVESREFEPPVDLPLQTDHPDLEVLGHAVFRSRRQRFGILPDDRRRHLLLLGKTGMGKSTLLQQLIAADVRAGKGVALIDPHGDLAESVLQCVPSNRTNDVVLFDAGDTHHPLSFNVLTCSSIEQRPLVASGVVSAFKKLYSDFWGPRLEHILRNAVLALLEVPGSSLISIVRLLSDRRYREALIERVSDPAVRAFWQQEFANMPQKLQLEAIAPIQNKVGHFVSSPILRNILGQSRSSLNLREIMDEGKVLIANVSKGRIGDDASALLGSLLVTGLQIAAMSRADLPELQRSDFYVFVDEFQNFATESFATILSEARKYRVGLTLANQYLAQMEESVLAAIFGNVGSLVVFQVGAHDCEILSQQLGGDVQPQDLLKLPRYQALVRLLIDGMPSRPFSMQTLPPSSLRSDPLRALRIRRYSRQRYGRPAKQVEREIAAAFTGG